MRKVKVDAVEIEVPRRAARRFRHGVAALLGAAFAAPGTPAQLPSGFSGGSSASTFSGDEAWRTLVAFGNCFATRNRPQALQLIATEPATRSERDTYRQIFRHDNQCVGGDTELDMSLPMIRGAIAEGLYKSRTELPANLAQAPVEAGAVRTLGEAARCLATARREQVRALVEETRAGSRQEYEALNAMAPDFFRCVPEGARGRRFDTTQVRYRLAEALLRMPAPAATGQAR
jgi:hypothetical protein